MSNVLVWADIPVLDLERASKFYAHITGGPVVPMEGAEGIALIMGTEPGGPDGDIMTVSADLYVGGTPSADGPTIYFNANGDIDGFVARVKEAGGTVTAEKAFMGPMVGWIAFFLDTEGNRIGVQQPG
jgi:uncharacterized protein